MYYESIFSNTVGSETSKLSLEEKVHNILNELKQKLDPDKDHIGLRMGIQWDSINEKLSQYEKLFEVSKNTFNKFIVANHKLYKENNIYIIYG